MIGNAQTIIDWLSTKDRDKIFEIRERKRKRSLNANAYAWALISEIAEALGTSKESAYMMMLKRYGQSDMVSVISSIDVTGYFKYFEAVATAKLQGKEFTHYRVYKGSSEYNSKEMAVLIDGIVSEAKELEIETLPPYEIERLKDNWKL